jgi:PST family polysaccharide transporter
MGFIMIAKGAGKLFFVSELLSSCVYLGLVWLCVPSCGLVGTGMGFCGVNIFCGLFVFVVARHLSGFSWSPANKRIGLLYCPIVVGLFVSWYVLPHVVAVIVGTAVTLLAGIYSLKTLCTLIPVERFPQPTQKLLVLFRLAPSTNV